MGAVAKSYMRKGFLIYEEMRKYLVIREEAVNHIWLFNRSFRIGFPYIWGKFSFLFYQCMDAHLVDEEPVDAVLALELVDLKDALLRAVRPVHHPFKHSQPTHYEKCSYKNPSNLALFCFAAGKHYTTTGFSSLSSFRPLTGWDLHRFEWCHFQPTSLLFGQYL